MGKLNFNWLLVIVIAVLTGMLFYGVYEFWQINYQQRCLRQKLLQLPAIASLELHNQRGILQLDIEPCMEADFPTLAMQVKELLEQERPGQGIAVNWISRTDARLLQLRQQMELPLREAQRRHEYVLLSQRLQQIVADEPVTCQLGVDNSQIYLKLRSGDHQLVEAMLIIEAGSGEH